MNNIEAIELLRNTGQIVTLVVARVSERLFEDTIIKQPSLSHGLSREDLTVAISNGEHYGKFENLCIFYYSKLSRL